MEQGPLAGLPQTERGFETSNARRGISATAVPSLNHLHLSAKVALHMIAKSAAKPSAPLFLRLCQSLQDVLESPHPYLESIPATDDC